MNKIKCLGLAGAALIVANISNLAFADISVNPQLCASTIQTNQSHTDPSATSILDACLQQNMCSQINGIDNCAGILAQLDFDSNYQTIEKTSGNNNGNTGHFGSSLPVPPSNNGGFGATHQNNSSNNVAAQTPVSPYNKAPTNNNSNDIHWF